MRIVANTLLLSCKRCINRVSFWIGLLVLPLLLCGISSLTKDTISDWNIALYTEESGLSESAISSLCKENSFFHFYQTGSLEEMQEDIMAKRAECGFYFQEGFEEAFYQRNLDGQIMIYYAPSTIADKAARESVFSAVLKEANTTLLEEFFQKETGMEADSELRTLYQKYAENGNIFHFTYEELEEQEKGIEQNQFLLSPVRGVFAIYVWAIALFSILSVYEDEKNGIYPLLQKRQCIVLKWCTVWIPVLLISFAGLVGIGICGMLQNPLMEGIAALTYGIAVTICALALQHIWKNPGYYSCFVTLLLTAGVVFCPVFVSMEKFFPQLSWIQKLFIPDYYLEIFLQNNQKEMIFGIIGNIVLYEITKFLHRE